MRRLRLYLWKEIKFATWKIRSMYCKMVVPIKASVDALRGVGVDGPNQGACCKKRKKARAAIGIDDWRMMTVVKTKSKHRSCCAGGPCPAPQAIRLLTQEGIK